jgi:hypothetical protein
VKQTRAWPRWPQHAPLVAGRGRQLLGLCLSGGKVHHQDPLYLKCGLMPRRHVRLNRGSDLLAGELASQCCYLLIGSGLLSMSLHLLPSMTSMMSLKRDTGFRPRHHHPWWNRRCGLNGQSVLHPWCGCDGSELSPRAMPPRRGEAKAPVPA